MRRLARAVGAAAVGFAVAFGVAAALAAPIGWIAAYRINFFDAVPGFRRWTRLPTT